MGFLFQNKTEKNPKRSFFFEPKITILGRFRMSLDGLDFEVETNERKYQTFQILLLFSICLQTNYKLKNPKTILNKVVECSEAFWILALVDINE